jgi:hypothetical protein
MTEGTIWLFAFLVDLVHHYARLSLFTLIPALFEKEDLARIQGTRAVIVAVSRVAAPLAGGAIIAGIGMAASLVGVAALQVMGLMLTLLLLRASPYHRVASTASEEPGEGRHPILLAARSTLRAAVAIARDARWRRFVALNTGSRLLISVGVLLWVPLLRSFHHVSEGATGMFLSLGAAGTVAGGLVMSRTSAVAEPSRRLAAALVFTSVGLVAAVCGSGAGPRVILATLVFHGGLTLFLRTSEVYLQSHLPHDKLGSWYGAMDAADRTLGLVGVLWAGALFDRVGAAPIYGCLALLLVAHALMWIRKPASLGVEQAA